MTATRPGLEIISGEEMQRRMNERKNPPWYVNKGMYPRGKVLGRKTDELRVVLVERVYKQAMYTGKNPWKLLLREIARRLAGHEYGHAVEWPLENHSGNIMERFLHAVRVGFDLRGSNWLFRLRRGDRVRWIEAMTWFDGEDPVWHKSTGRAKYRS